MLKMIEDMKLRSKGDKDILVSTAMCCVRPCDASGLAQCALFTLFELRVQIG